MEEIKYRVKLSRCCGAEIRLVPKLNKYDTLTNLYAEVCSKCNKGCEGYKPIHQEKKSMDKLKGKVLSWKQWCNNDGDRINDYLRGFFDEYLEKEDLYEIIKFIEDYKDEKQRIIDIIKKERAETFFGRNQSWDTGFDTALDMILKKI